MLVAFHGWLFATQVAAGRLEDPWLVFRWTIAVGLIAALVAIRRSGASIWSRQGIAVWVLAALLHGPAVATDFSDSVNKLALPETVATSVLQLVSVTALAVTLWMLAGLLARRDRHARLYAGLVAAPVSRRHLRRWLLAAVLLPTPSATRVKPSSCLTGN